MIDILVNRTQQFCYLSRQGLTSYCGKRWWLLNFPLFILFNLFFIAVFQALTFVVNLLRYLLADHSGHWSDMCLVLPVRYCAFIKDSHYWKAFICISYFYSVMGFSNIMWNFSFSRLRYDFWDQSKSCLIHLVLLITHTHWSLLSNDICVLINSIIQYLFAMWSVWHQYNRYCVSMPLRI